MQEAAKGQLSRGCQLKVIVNGSFKKYRTACKAYDAITMQVQQAAVQ